MKIVQVSDNKLCEIAEGLEDVLYSIMELKEGGYGERNTYGMRMGYRGDDEDVYPVMSRYGERRRRNRYGRFV